LWSARSSRPGHPPRKDAQSGPARRTANNAAGTPRGANGKRDKDKAVVFHRIKPKRSNLQPQEVFMYAEAAMDRSFGVIWFNKGQFSNNSKSKYGLHVRWNYMFRHRRDEGMDLVFFDGHVEYATHQDWTTPPQWSYWN
jgi:prepilin-type processing-associated H-X9-DG protein